VLKTGAASALAASRLRREIREDAVIKILGSAARARLRPAACAAVAKNGGENGRKSGRAR